MTYRFTYGKMKQIQREKAEKMKLTTYQAFHLSVQMNYLLMHEREFKQIAKEQFGITVKNADFQDLNKSRLLESMRRRLLNATADDWSNLESEIELYNCAEDLEHATITKMTEDLLIRLKTDRPYANEINDLELEGVNIVTGAQLLQDFKDAITIGGYTPSETTDEFKYRMNYKPHGLYIWSESVEDAVPVESLEEDDLDSVGISENLYSALKQLPSQI